MSAVITGAAPFQTERPSGVAEAQEPPAAQATEAPKIPAEPLAAATAPKSPQDTSAGSITMLSVCQLHYDRRIDLSLKQ